MGKRLFLISVFVPALWLKAAAQLRLPPPPAQKFVLKTAAPLPQNFYNNHLSFFCKKESQLQKATGLNVFIRLGGKDYVDWLEQKPNAVRSW